MKKNHYIYQVPLYSMKKIILCAVTVVVVVLSLFGCRRHPELPVYRHYLTDLVRVDTIVMKPAILMNNEKNKESVAQSAGVEQAIILLYARLCEKKRQPGGPGGFSYIGIREDILIRNPDPERIAYIISIGDNHYRDRSNDPYWRDAGIWYPITSFSVKCNKDLNEHFKAGDELNSITLLRFDDNYTYIKKRYNGKKPPLKTLFANDNERLQRTLVPGENFEIYLTEIPTGVAGEEVEFSIEVSFANGNVETQKSNFQMPQNFI